MGCLIVSVPDLCLLSYFTKYQAHKNTCVYLDFFYYFSYILCIPIHIGLSYQAYYSPCEYLDFFNIYTQKKKFS